MLEKESLNLSSSEYLFYLTLTPDHQKLFLSIKDEVMSVVKTNRRAFLSLNEKNRKAYFQMSSKHLE